MFNSVSRTHIRITIAQHPTSTQKDQTTAQHFHVTDTGNWWPENHVQVTSFPGLPGFTHETAVFQPLSWIGKTLSSQLSHEEQQSPSSTAIFQLGIVALLLQSVCVWVKLFVIYMTPTFASIVLSMMSLSVTQTAVLPTIYSTFSCGNLVSAGLA